ncbi:hypothetical protein NUV26_09795 [Burkholderia pseudomultivorans]|uniref:hypothetical protein n=1 Tax=Burkholderia pseudomultivorans TaxID=1207504 RepID=UPI000ACAAD7D|nr:hypothetical protein [Burkholderia pseudomultivorans]MDS0792446.1 hypothetical protein [Burkholderia pseudomultivorans]
MTNDGNEPTPGSARDGEKIRRNLADGVQVGVFGHRVSRFYCAAHGPPEVVPLATINRAGYESLRKII